MNELYQKKCSSMSHRICCILIYPKEERTIIDEISLAIVDKFINFDFNSDAVLTENNGVKRCTESVLSLGILYWEYWMLFVRVIASAY